MNCWEMFDCKVKEQCPTYPDHGRYCARVAGTLCQGKKKVMMANKIEGCNQCRFYQSEHYDITFRGFIRSGPKKTKQKDAVEASGSVTDTIETKIDTLLDQFQSGAIDKKNLTDQIAPLLEQKNYVLANAGQLVTDIRFLTPVAKEQDRAHSG